MEQWATIQLAIQQQQQQQQTNGNVLATPAYNLNTLLIAEPNNLSSKPPEVIQNVAANFDTSQRYDSPGHQTFQQIPAVNACPEVNTVVTNLQLTCDKVTHQLTVDAETVLQQTVKAIEDAKHQFRLTVFSLAKHLRESVLPPQPMFSTDTNPQFAQICYNVSWELLKTAQNISYELTKSLDASGKELVRVTRNAVRQLGVEIPDPLYATSEHVPPLTLPVTTSNAPTMIQESQSPVVIQHGADQQSVEAPTGVQTEDDGDMDNDSQCFEDSTSVATPMATSVTFPDSSTGLITVKAVDIEFMQPVPLYAVTEPTHELPQDPPSANKLTQAIDNAGPGEGGTGKGVGEIEVDSLPPEKIKRKRTTTKTSKSPKKTSFTCGLCDRVFLHAKSFRFHKMRAHSSERPFKCEHCDKQFVRAYELKRHQQVHTGKPQFKCPECPKEFYQKKSFEFHMMKNHTDQRPFVCKVCKFGFVKASALRSHMIIHSQEKCFKCEFCDRAFARERNLLQHRTIHTGEKSHLCKICGEKFMSIWFLQRHTEKHKCDIEGKVLCHLCDKPFADADIKAHVMTHATEKEYDACDNVLPDSTALIKHNRNVDDSPHASMDKGSDGYENEEEQHKSSEHEVKKPPKGKTKASNNKQVVCDQCGKSVQKGRLQLHLNTHEGKKPFKCEQCPKEYHVKKSLDIHIMVKHGGTRPFQCDLCPKGFPTSYDLKQHRLIHDKKHKCNICDRAFSSSKHLVEHMTVHTGEKPFACKLCAETFARYSHLAKHCKTVHGQYVSGKSCPNQEKQRKLILR